MPIEHLELGCSSDPSSSVDRSKRRRLDDISVTIAKAKRVVVVSGAGISCSSGIPDFRSENGLYSLVKKRYPDTFVTGKDLFSSGLFTNPATTSIFLTFIAEMSLACQAATPTRTHHFIQKLERTGKLLRSYTQNIDGFERRMGMESGGRGRGLSKKETKNVELHGDLGRVRCVLCQADHPAKQEWVEDFREGSMPDCPTCEERCKQRVGRGSRALAIGSLRPSIVLYDEPHPLGDAIGDLQSYDLKRGPDVLLIMGTSLKVHGLKHLVKSFAKSVHAEDDASGPKKKKRGVVIFVNQTKPGKEWEGFIDVHVQGETDKWVERVEEEWRRVRPVDWEVQTTLDVPVLAQIGDAEKTEGGKVPVPSKGKSKSKAKGTDKENQPIYTNGVLPTPRPSLSPSAAPADKSARGERAEPSSPTRPVLSKTAIGSYFPLSPPASPQAEASEAPEENVAPLSPSKRRANVHTPLGAASPSKKPKAPQTGVTATPGRGNLFGAPRKDIINLADEVDPVELNQAMGGEWEDEVFGVTPKKVGTTGGTRGAPSKARGRGRTAGKVDLGEKENAPMKATSAKGRAKAGSQKVAGAVVAKRGGVRAMAGR